MNDIVQHLQPRKNLKSYGDNGKYKIIYIPWYKNSMGMMNPWPKDHMQLLWLCCAAHSNICQLCTQSIKNY
jgi:hypothetical protein